MLEKVLLSPNYSKKSRNREQIKFVILHYTGMQSEIESIKRLQNSNSKVSCHYLINKKGKIIQMVKDNKVAWHAGKSKWKNLSNLNFCSLGIELVNKGHQFGYEKFPNLQIESLILLCKKLKKKYKISKQNFLGHSDVAPLRKLDPGEKFPWQKLNNYGFGVGFENKSLGSLKLKTDKSKIKKLFFKNLFKIGYRYFDLNKRNNKKDKLVIKAFQRRFLPKRINGKIDKKTYIISHFLANNVEIT